MDRLQPPWKAIIEGLPSPVIITDANLAILWLNGEALRLFGVERSSIQGSTLTRLIHIDNRAVIPPVGPANSPHPRNSYRQPQRIEAVASKGDGSQFTAHVTFTPIQDEVTPILRYSVAVESRAGKTGSVDELRLSSQVFQHSGEPIMITDPDDRIISVNKAFTRITGYADQDVLGRSPAFLREGLNDAASHTEMWRRVNATGHWSGEIINRKKNGESYPAWLSLSAVRNNHDEVDSYISIFSDISSHSHELRKFRHLAHHDHLTGLPNRVLLEDRFDQAVARQRRHGTGKVALLFIDLNNFKSVNDQFGHHKGDEVLKTVADTLCDVLRQEDTVCRFGGDEFIALVTLPRLNRSLDSLTEKICTRIAASCHALVPIPVGASIGISIYPDNGTTLESLIHHADTAMYREKQGKPANHSRE